MTPEEYKQKALRMVTTGWGLHYSHQVLLWILAEKGEEGILWKKTHIDRDGLETITTSAQQNLHQVFRDCDALELRERFYKMSEHPEARKRADDWLLSACIVYSMKNGDKLRALWLGGHGVPLDEA